MLYAFSLRLLDVILRYGVVSKYKTTIWHVFNTPKSINHPVTWVSCFSSSFLSISSETKSVCHRFITNTPFTLTTLRVTSAAPCTWQIIVYREGYQQKNNPAQPATCPTRSLITHRIFPRCNFPPSGRRMVWKIHTKQIWVSAACMCTHVRVFDGGNPILAHFDRLLSLTARRSRSVVTSSFDIRYLLPPDSLSVRESLCNCCAIQSRWVCVSIGIYGLERLPWSRFEHEHVLFLPYA